MRRLVLIALAFGVLAACGKKGPPLPPLIRLPAAPQSLAGIRQGDTVLLTVKVPEGNIDGVTPADITRLDVYALTGLASIPPAEIIRRGTRVGSVPVNPPPDPDAPEGAEPDPERKIPGGIDQGGTAALVDTIAAATEETDDARVYVAVGVNRRGRRGTPSASLAIPLSPAPAPPPAPMVTYDETSVTLAWPSGDGATEPQVHVYDVTSADRRLTERPVAGGTFVDERMEFDVERCYALRRVVAAGGTTVESDASTRACLTPKDTFPPEAPTELNAVPEVGAVSLIWNPVEAADLAGYVVYRAVAPATEPVALNSEPLSDTTFRDTVPSGARVRYVIEAVDKSGNRSQPSAAIEETVR